MTIFTPRTFRRQPEFGQEQVDWTNPLTKGLVGAYVLNMISGTLRDVAGTCGACTPGNPAVPLFATMGPFGKSAYFTLPSGANNSFVNSSYVLPTSDTTTVQVLETSIVANGSTFGNRDTSASGGNANRYQANLPFGSTVFFDFGGVSAPNRVSYTPAASFWNDWHVMAFYAGSSGMGIYADGALQVSSATAVTRTNAATGFMIGSAFSSPSSGGNWSKIAMHLLFTRILTASEIMTLTRDPYCIFVPRRTRYGLAATGSSAIAGTASVQPCFFIGM